MLYITKYGDFMKLCTDRKGEQYEHFTRFYRVIFVILGVFYASNYYIIVFFFQGTS